MKKILSILIAALFITPQLNAQVEPTAGTWKTWFITSGKAYRLPQPGSYKDEIAQVISAQKNLDSAGLQQILYWNIGAPGFHWQEMINKLWTVDTGRYGLLANMLLGTATYDATIAAWDTKYTYKRPRPFVADNRIKVYTVKPESPSYPNENSIAAGVAVAIFSRFFPALTDSVNHMAQRLMTAQVAAGVAFPSDVRAGFELGKKIAEKEIEQTINFINQPVWDGKIPEGPNRWRGKFAMSPTLGLNKTIVLKSGSQLRPPPPPDFTKDMAEVKNFKRTLRSNVNAYNYAAGVGYEVLDKKILEYNLHLNPPRAARIYAASAVASYDAFVACWDAKYTYWGIRPDQYDTSYHALLQTPPFPGYPSGHAVMCGMIEGLYYYFFPIDKALFRKIAKDGAESRFQAGIHFRTDNEVGLDLGRKVTDMIIEKLRVDGADANLPLSKKQTAKNNINNIRQ